MPRIVKEAKPKRVKCDECGAIIEFFPEEPKERRWKDYSGDSNYEKYIACPRVGKNNKKCPGEGIIESE